MSTMIERLMSHIVGPMTPAQESYSQALEVVDEQLRTIEMQRAHIKRLDERVAKLEHEADGLRSLL